MASPGAACCPLNTRWPTEQLKGIVISNMTASIADYLRHLHILRSRMDSTLQDEMAQYEAREDYFHPRYLDIMEMLYARHILSLANWPPAVTLSLSRTNQDVYGILQGPNEFVVTGTFKDWEPRGGPGSHPRAGVAAGRSPRHHGPCLHRGDGEPHPRDDRRDLPGRQSLGHVGRPCPLLSPLLEFLERIKAR